MLPELLQEAHKESSHEYEKSPVASPTASLFNFMIGVIKRRSKLRDYFELLDI